MFATPEKSELYAKTELTYFFKTLDTYSTSIGQDLLKCGLSKILHESEFLAAIWHAHTLF